MSSERVFCLVVLDLKARLHGSQPPAKSEPQPENGLTAADAPADQAAQPDADALRALMNAIQSRVFAGDSYQDLSLRMDDLQSRFTAAPTRELILQSVAGAVCLLENYQQRLQEANRETAHDFRRILSLVNESFTCLQAGDRKAEERLKYLETNLREATKIDSLGALRRHLSGMLDYVRQEQKVDLGQNESRLESLSGQMRQAQLVSQRLQVQMPGRAHALEHMRSLMAASSGSSAAQISLFVVDGMSALRARHGEEIASHIMDELVRRQIQPLDPEGKLFCWSASSLMLVSRPRTGVTSAGLLRALPAAFEHRAFTGTRVATFKLRIRSLSKSLSDGVDEVAATFDRFSKDVAS